MQQLAPFVQTSDFNSVFYCVVNLTNSLKSDAFLQFCKDALGQKDCYFYIKSGQLLENQSETFDSVDALVSTIEEDTENFGVMMYFGDSSKSKLSLPDFRRELLNHVIDALQVL